MDTYLTIGDKVIGHARWNGQGNVRGVVIGDKIGSESFSTEDRVMIAWADGVVTTVIAGWVTPIREEVAG